MFFIFFFGLPVYNPPSTVLTDTLPSKNGKIEIIILEVVTKALIINFCGIFGR